MFWCFPGALRCIRATKVLVKHFRVWHLAESPDSYGRRVAFRGKSEPIGSLCRRLLSGKRLTRAEILRATAAVRRQSTVELSLGDAESGSSLAPVVVYHV